MEQGTSHPHRFSVSISKIFLQISWKQQWRKKNPETDFEIKDNGNSEYFYAINKNLLILDSGTGSENRGVTIYNLDTRKEVFTDTYNMDGVDNLNIKENAMTYWSTNFKQTVTKQNCPQYYNSGKFVSHISMDLSTLIKTDLNEDKCVYSQ